MPRCGACNTEVASFVLRSSTKFPKVWIAAGAGSENIQVTRLLPNSPPSPLKIPCSSLPSKSSPPSGNHSRGSDSLRRRIRAGLGSVQLPLQIQVRLLPPPRPTLLSSAPPLLLPGFLLDTGGCSPPRSSGALFDCGGDSPPDPVAPRPCSTRQLLSFSAYGARLDSAGCSPPNLVGLCSNPHSSPPRSS
jgi:hypothetical protein